MINFLHEVLDITSKFGNIDFIHVKELDSGKLLAMASSNDAAVHIF